MKQVRVYKIDLTMIDGSGDFPCPRCGNQISPDDVTEKNYAIMEPKVNDQGLIEIVIQCNKCESFIHLIGFSLLQKISILNEGESAYEEKEEPCGYISHI